MKISRIFSLLIILLIPIALRSQEAIQYKKLYLHTDRDIYFLGDTVWFKGYYLDANSHQFVSGIYSMYSELIDEKGNPIQSQVFSIENGVAAGRLLIPDSLEAGEYVLRAFTDLQRDLGEEMFFHKTVKIASIMSGAEETVQSSMARGQNIDVAFLPEGGYLLSGHNNIVGIKAIDANGKSISVNGKVLDGAEEVVSTFATKYMGMDTIHFDPKEGETYKVEIEGFPEYKYEFRGYKEEGIKLEFLSESKYELQFSATTNSKRFQRKDYVFAIMHRGQVIYQQGFVQEEESIPIKVNRAIIPGGISRYVLLDDKLRPISERLLFLKKDELHRIDISLDKGSYDTRSKVLLELIDELEIDSESFSSLSIAVVDEKTIGENGSDMDIHSWLLIDSELKGSIESPSDYFTNDTALSSENKLDLLMLTHGWSKYIWNELPKKEMPVDIREEEGFSVSGNVIKNFSKKATVNGKVSLMLFNNDHVFTRETRTDENGLFSFDGLIFTDTASIFLQAWNEKEQTYRRVDINPLFKDSPAISRIYLPTPELTLNIPKELEYQKYSNEMSIREYIMKTGSFFIEEVEVVAKKGDGIYRKMYTKPSSSLKVTMADYSYGDVFDYLQGRVPGLTVRYRKTEYGLEKYIGIRSTLGTLYGSTDVLFLLNGMPISSLDAQYIPLAEINVIDVLKSVGETAIFGISGANGVVLIYTKMGMSDEDYNADPVGIISEKICGYSPDREFYTPAYSPENIDTERPDHRMTLYWNPYVTAENGKASVSFFTSDDIARYRIFVEGVTQTGEICLGTAELVVNQENSQRSGN